MLGEFGSEELEQQFFTLYRENAIRGATKVLGRLLVIKFGDLGRSIRKRLKDASEQEVAAWTERLLGATSLDEVFAEPTIDFVEYFEGWRAEHRAAGVSRGLARGRSKGRAEGHAQGLAEGEARILLHQLGCRFGPLDAAIRERVSAASPEDLAIWSLRVLSAPTLADAFAVS